MVHQESEIITRNRDVTVRITFYRVLEAQVSD
jgi:hypothetical protein